MQDGLINQNDQPYNPQIPNPPNIPQPQLNTQPEIQAAPQPLYAQQVPQQNYPQPYVAGPVPQPYVAGPVPQPYTAYPVYIAQPDIQINADLKKKLCCPKVFSWVVFFIALIYEILVLLSGLIDIIGIIISITHFIVARLISQSAETGDAKKYRNALILHIIISCITVIIFIIGFVMLSKIYLSGLIVDMIIVAPKIILLIVLLCYKKEFDTPASYPGAIAPQVL